MRNDVLNQLSSAQVCGAGSTVSTNSIAKKNTAQDLGIGSNPPTMGLCFAPTVNAAGATSWNIELIEAENGALTTNVVSLAMVNLLTTELKAGKKFFLALPPGKMNSVKTHFGARYTAVGGSGEQLTVDAYFGSSDDVANFKSFPSTYNVAN